MYTSPLLHIYSFTKASLSCGVVYAVMTNKSSDKLQRNKDANAVMSRAAQNEVSFTINENIEALKDRYMTMDCNINIPSFDDAKEKQLRKDIFDYILNNLDFDQLIWEFGNANNPDWVHVSYISPELNRKQVFKATKNKQNKTIYVNYNENKLQS